MDYLKNFLILFICPFINYLNILVIIIYLIFILDYFNMISIFDYPVVDMSLINVFKIKVLNLLSYFQINH